MQISSILIVCGDSCVEREIQESLGFPIHRADSGDGPPSLVIVYGSLTGKNCLRPPTLAVVDDAEQGLSALEQGADDFVVRPFSARELNLRIGAILRRIQLSFRFGNVVVDFQRAMVFVDGEEVNISNKELQLLRYLIACRGRIVTREELLRNVWRYRSSQTRTVDFHIASLRKKLHQRDLIVTVPKQGYRLAAA